MVRRPILTSVLFCATALTLMCAKSEAGPEASAAVVAGPEVGAALSPADTTTDGGASVSKEEEDGDGPPAAGRLGRLTLGPRRNAGRREMMLAFEVNGNVIDNFAQVIRDRDGHYFVKAELLTASRLPVPKVASIFQDQTAYYPLSAIPGLTYRLDEAQQKLIVILPASSFNATIVGFAGGQGQQATLPDPGLFLNHDIQISGSDTRTRISALEEVGFFSKLGVFTTRYMAGDLPQQSVVRLDSQLVRDFPERMATLTIGDGISAGSSWGRSVNYAGIRWGTKFTTQPSFIPFALPTVVGQAAQPSTVDLYLNNIRTAQQNVDAGPFAIHDIPTITAQGELRMVVTDITGRQQVISTPYISTPQLLKEAVSDYSYEAGTLRTGFGFKSLGYQSWFVQGTHARGITDSLTLSLRGELQQHGATLGGGLDKGLLRIGVLGFGGAISEMTNGGTGSLAYMHFQRATRAFSLSASAQVTSQDFRQLGLVAGEQPTRLLAQAQVSRNLGRQATIALAYLRQNEPSIPVFDRDGKRLSHFTSLSPGLNLNLRSGMSIVLSSYYAPELRRRASANISLFVPLGRRRSLAASTGYQDGKTNPSVEVAQQTPVGTGWGYRLRTSTSNDVQDPRVDAGATYQNSTGRYQFEVGQERAAPTSWRFDYSGGTVLMHRHLGLSPSLTDGFALVDASGTPGVRVLANNQYVATTDQHGLAIVPNLPAYYNNLISLDDKNVPMDLDLDLASKTAVPMPRSGLFINFKAKQTRGAVLKLVSEDGTDLPVGAEASVNGSKETYQVVLRGELYLPEVSFPANLLVRWDDATCQADVPAPESPNELLPQVGPITCRKVK